MTYKESKEFKDILEKSENRSSSICEKIMNEYRDWEVDNTLIKSRQDVHFEKLLILEGIILDIKSTCEWAKILKEHFRSEIENLELMLKKSILDTELIDWKSNRLEWLGVSLSCKSFTHNDLQKHRARIYRNFYHAMNALIDEEKPKEPIDTEVYES